MDRGLDRNGLKIVLLAPALLFLAGFYFYPLAEIFKLGFRPERVWDPSPLKRLFSTPYFLRVLWFTTWQAALSTLLALVTAVPAALVFARYRFFGKRLLQALTTVPFVLPTVVVAAAFQALLGSRGLVNDLSVSWLGFDRGPIRIDQSLGLIFLAHVFYNFTVVFRIVGGFWERLQASLTEAARMLGASSWTALRQVALPLLRPALYASGLLVFIFCFSSFGIILILGGPRYSTIEVEIYRQAVHLFNLPMAAALSMVQILFSLALMWVYTGLQRRATVTLYPESRTVTQRRPKTASDRLAIAATVLGLFLLIGLPLLALLVRSFRGDSGWTVSFYQALFHNPSQSIFYVAPIEAMLNSLAFALATLVVTLALAVPAAIFLAQPLRRLNSLLDPVLMLPLSTSAVTLGFGFIVALDEPPLNLRTSWILVPLAHSLVAFPFVVRSLLPALRSIPANLREAAGLLGADPWTAWKTVDLPILARALVVGAVFALVISLGEFGATVFVARPQTPTLPLAIYRFLSQPGSLNYGQAMAMSCLLMLVTVIGFLFLERVAALSHREF